MRPHYYKATIEWTGNLGSGTSAYKAYSRNHTISIEGKSIIEGSADKVFRGDKNMHNPEELLVASVSACHMLTYLHVCADAGVVVVSYSDEASATMIETKNGGRITQVQLHPKVTVKDASMVILANRLHHTANSLCFIANSCNFPIIHAPVCIAEQT